MRISFRVDGVPVPKGSTKSFVINGRTATTNANPKTKDWQYRVSTECQHVCAIKREQGINTFVPKTNNGMDCVGVSVEFYFLRPKADKKGIRAMTVKPDIDKLLRTILDALTGIIYEDDSQVTFIQGTKNYVSDGGSPFVDVTIYTHPDKTS